EVAVTRRVHRDGESEFLINGSKVRLRDIQELFTSSGLGQESYALMGQGLVEEVLRLKPEERRGLIEEVADVRRHRVKMLDARRKREQSHENLERARLLVEEIEPRMRTLERQAKRALQHAELSAELQAALRRFYRSEGLRLQSDLAGRRVLHDQRRSEQSGASRGLEEAEGSLARWDTEIKAAREALEEVSSEQRERAARVRELEHEQELERQREAMLREGAEQLHADLDALSTEADPDDDAEGAAQAESMEAGAARARATQTEAETVLQAAESALAALRERALEIDQRERALATLDKEASQAGDRLAQEREQLQAREGQRAAMLLADREALMQAEELADAALQRAAQAGSEAQSARESRQELSNRFYSASAYLRGLESSRADRERRLTRARDRLQMLQELQAESEGIHQGLRALFGSRGVPREGEDTGIPGVVGVMRRLVRAPKGLEHAIEAALEGYIDAVVYESVDEALQTMQVLLTERAGRIVALPLDTIKHRPPLAIQAERGLIGVASSLVRCDDRLRELVDTLLGRTIVVEDQAAARTMLRRGLGAVVTQDGHLFRPNGSLAGGRLAEQGAFTRENELQALPGDIEQLERSLAESADVETKRAQLEEMETALRDAETISERATVARAAAQEEAAGRRADATRLRSDLQALDSEEKRSEARLAEIGREEAALALAISERQEEHSRVQQERPDPALVAEAVSSREAAATRAGETTAALRRVEGESEALQAAIRSGAAAQARAREQREARQVQLDQATEELAALARSIQAREENLDEARTASESVSADGGVEAQVVARLQGEETARRGSVQAGQRRLIESERGLVSAEAAVHETEAALAHLSEQMQGDDLVFDAAGGIARLGKTSSSPSAAAQAEAVPLASLEARTRREASVVSAISAAGLGASHETGGSHEAGASHETGAESGLEGGNGSSGGVGDPPQPAPIAPAPIDPDQLRELREEIEAVRGRLRWLGNVNPDAAAEYHEIQERHEFLSGQIEDLEGAEQRMLQAEADLAQLIQGKFTETFEAVDRHFRHYFQTMFRGGTGRLVLTDEDDFEIGGVDVVARPPGKKVDSLQMLSGGERSLTAMALLFAMLEVNPAPFSVLDEVDAALDEANVGRFVDGLKELAAHSQFVVITHNRRTIEQADDIYGITMSEDSVSRVLSVRLSDLELED
ncbi:MAG: hypothetical protein O7G30_01020, partial [Proteobacteria bacterium]|nr:hypothetical protein [Pseudomonadota bacterium]